VWSPAPECEHGEAQHDDEERREKRLTLAALRPVKAPSRLDRTCANGIAAGVPAGGTVNGVSSTTLTYGEPDFATASLSASNLSNRSLRLPSRNLLLLITPTHSSVDVTMRSDRKPPHLYGA
jgi:hypothetical protein